MMSKKKWFVLLCLFVVYLLLGAGIFYNIESQEEHKRLEKDKAERKKIEDMIKNHMTLDGQPPDFLKKLSDYCGKPLDVHMSEFTDEGKWDFYHSLFFVITVVSTIGYGNLAPTTMFTRIFMIFYGLIGIPMNGIVMVTLGGYFGRSTFVWWYSSVLCTFVIILGASRFTMCVVEGAKHRSTSTAHIPRCKAPRIITKFSKLYQRWKSSKMKNDTTRLGLISQIILYLVPGFTFFIFLPSVIMTVFEGWAYDVAVYYSFVTLTTIGFGDYVAGVTNESRFSPFWFTVYQIFLLVWVIGGLGYVVMILNFITQAMRSKKMQVLEQKITQNIKKTPVRIRQELRTLLQEFLFLRVKPVYKGEFDYVPTRIERSQSCPDLSLYRTSPTFLRKRARSECPRSLILHRIQSDTDLDKIDKDRTFQQPMAGAFMHQKDLLLKVVDALGNMTGGLAGANMMGEPPKRGPAYENLSDAEILASERFGSRWSMKSQKSPAPQRRRAISEVKSPVLTESPQMTWYGQGALQHLDSFRKRTFSEPSAEVLKTPEGFFAKIKRKIRLPSREEKDIERQDIEAPARTRTGSAFAPGDYLRQTSRGRASVLSTDQEAVLEHTSIADFIRALSAITVPETIMPPSASPKRRKLGTAGITPSTSPERLRRLAMRPNAQMRRSSLMPEVSEVQRERRRFSLRPVEENLLMPPPPPYSPPQEPVAPSSSRKLSRIASSFMGPVQRQLSKRDKEADN